MLERDLFAKMAQREREFRAQNFIAPYTKQSRIAIVKLDGANYQFRIVGFPAVFGVGVFGPVDPNCARFLKDADIELRRSYFDLLPKINLILCYETEDGWISFPSHLESSRHHFGLESEVLVRGVSDCERFDIVVARYDGIGFWYDEVFPGANPAQGESLRNCLQPHVSVERMRKLAATIKGVHPEQRHAFELAIVAWTLFQKVSTEDRIRKILADSGGHLGRFILRGENIEVHWKSAAGREYSSLIQKESLNVISAGICLSGYDRRFHLKDLPFIMSEGEKRGSIVVTADPTVGGLYRQTYEDE